MDSNEVARPCDALHCWKASVDAAQQISDVARETSVIWRTQCCWTFDLCCCWPRQSRLEFSSRCLSCQFLHSRARVMRIILFPPSLAATSHSRRSLHFSRSSCTSAGNAFPRRGCRPSGGKHGGGRVHLIVEDPLMSVLVDKSCV